MRIAFDHQAFDLQVYGGVSRYICELASQLAVLDNNVSISAPFFINNYLPNISKNVIVQGRQFKKFPKSQPIMRLLNDRLTSMRFSRNQPDIVHETYYSEHRSAPKKSKIILTVHDMIHEKMPDQVPKDNTREQKAAAVARADHIICISENTRKDLIEILNVPPQKTSVIKHGFTINAAATVNMASSRDKPFILYVGLRGGYKNFSTLLTAYSMSKEIQNSFDIICFGGGEFTPAEQSAISKLHRRASVRHISGSDGVLAGLYKSAALFVYPSMYEGFGIPPLEAMSFNCPVICSNASSIPEIVGDAALLFDPVDPAGLIRSIATTLNNRDLREKLIKNGKIKLLDYSWEKCAKETIDAYKIIQH
jgi:glycosyltransferase involved in cell wall biosynthesis